MSLMRDVPTLSDEMTVRDAVAVLLDSGLAALPVCEDGELLGVFGEREVIAAVLPGYVGELTGAAFLSSSLDEALEHRPECAREPISKHLNTEHVEAPADFSYAQLAEIFLHHRVSIVPVVEGRRVIGAVTRRDYVRALAERLSRDGA